MTRRHPGRAWVIAVVTLTVIPLGALAVQSLARGWFFPDLFPRSLTTAAFRDAWTANDAGGAMRQGLVISIAVTIISMTLAIPAARALTLSGGGARRLAVIVIGAPVVLPPLALAMGLQVFFLRVGIEEARTAVVIAHLAATLPYSVLILAAGMRRYDVGFETQAHALGLSDGAVLRRVFLPLARPVLAVTAALTFLVSWGQYLLTFLPGGGRVVTLPVLVLASSRGGNPTGAAALAIVAALPPLVGILLVVGHLDDPRRSRG